MAEVLGEIWAVAEAAGPVEIRVWVRGVTSYRFDITDTPQRIITEGVPLTQLVVQNLSATLIIELGNDRGLTYGHGLRIPPNAILAGGVVSSGTSGTTPTTGGGDLYNLLTNPGFEIVQRTPPFTASGAYAHDRWQITLGAGSTITVTDETAIVDVDSGHALKAIYVHGIESTISQYLRATDVHYLRGLTLSFRLRARVGTAAALRAVVITDGTGGTTTYSADHTGAGAFESLDVLAVAVPADATYVRVGASFIASCTAYLDNATLVVGADAQVYYPLHPAEEWARCQRYYEVHGGKAGNSMLVEESANGAHAFGGPVAFGVLKAVNPTMTKTGTWAVTNCAQPTVAHSYITEYTLHADAVAAGAASFNANGADDTITAEANP